MYVPLNNAGPAHGGKAAGLGRALRAGHRVPAGIVIPASTPLAGLAAVLPAWIDQTDVVVRSSASIEDGSVRSGAGIYDTVLGVRGRTAVAEAVGTVRASLDSDRARAYSPAVDARMHVIVQAQVNADLGGVLVTDGARVLVEHARGGPATVVSGTVTPQRYTGTGPAPAPLDGVVDLGRELAAELGHDVDVEWAIDGDQLWLLQVRAVTAPVSHIAGTDTLTDPAGIGELAGTGASPGIATGPIRVVNGPADFPSVQAGDILVCRTTDPSWTPLLHATAAVITEIGGVLSHAAIVARERGVPAVVGLSRARDLLRTGQPVTVDGQTGTVTRFE